MMLQARVDQTPVTAVMQESQSQARSSPETLGGRLKSSPLPPARWTDQAIIAMAAMGAKMSLMMKSQRSRVGGIIKSGNWMIQNRK